MMDSTEFGMGSTFGLEIKGTTGKDRDLPVEIELKADDYVSPNASRPYLRGMGTLAKIGPTAFLVTVRHIDRQAAGGNKPKTHLSLQPVTDDSLPPTEFEEEEKIKQSAKWEVQYAGNDLQVLKWVGTEEELGNYLGGMKPSLTFNDLPEIADPKFPIRASIEKIWQKEPFMQRTKAAADSSLNSSKSGSVVSAADVDPISGLSTSFYGTKALSDSLTDNTYYQLVYPACIPPSLTLQDGTYIPPSALNSDKITSKKITEVRGGVVLSTHTTGAINGLEDAEVELAAITNLPCCPGMSGGGVFKDGKLIGVVEAGSHHVPVNYLLLFTDTIIQILNGDKKTAQGGYSVPTAKDWKEGVWSRFKMGGDFPDPQGSAIHAAVKASPHTRGLILTLFDWTRRSMTGKEGPHSLSRPFSEKKNEDYINYLVKHEAALEFKLYLVCQQEGCNKSARAGFKLCSTREQMAVSGVNNLAALISQMEFTKFSGGVYHYCEEHKEVAGEGEASGPNTGGGSGAVTGEKKPEGSDAADGGGSETSAPNENGGHGEGAAFGDKKAPGPQDLAPPVFPPAGELDGARRYRLEERLLDLSNWDTPLQPAHLTNDFFWYLHATAGSGAKEIGPIDDAACTTDEPPSASELRMYEELEALPHPILIDH